MKDITELKKYPVILTVSDIAKFMEVSMSYSYMLAERKRFPAKKLGSRTLILKKHFIQWLECDCFAEFGGEA